MGRFTRDPDLRSTGTGVKVASFTLAVDRDYKSQQSGERETDFIDCVAWRNTGEFVCNYFNKGSMAVVEGRLQIREWNDRDNNKRKSAEIVVDNIYFGEGKKSEGRQTFRNEVHTPEPPAQMDFTEIEVDDGDLPF
jgi:single-strand DNA-binding protein